MNQISSSIIDTRYTVPEIAKITKMSEAFWRKAIFLGRVEVERYGRAVRVTEGALQRYLTARKPGDVTQ